ncbi:MAG: hypothetical protein CSB32_01065 [Desulfobacterales bacterium]|nr:MAG: hypothetical protein CSB32_01065 [Desulfobacterales bacterium]
MRLSLFPLLLLLVGCSVSTNVSENRVAGLTAEKESLWQIQIRRWGESRFTGILVVRPEEEGVRYVVLDKMGISLLRGCAAKDGGDSPPARGVLARTLGPFLSEMLSRIVQEPEERPCSAGMFARLCVKEEPLERKKIKTMLGLQQWVVIERRVSPSEEPLQTVEIEYLQPLFGVEVVLRLIGGDEK